MALKRISYKFLKVAGLIAGSFVILLTAFHFWFVYHAEEIIQDLVASRSDGKIRLEVRNFKFNWFSKKMALEDAVFYNTDSVKTGTIYRFAVPRINLKVKAVYPMIFEDKVLINNLSLKAPDIQVIRIRPRTRDSAHSRDVSIPREMGRIYNSIQDALSVLQVKKFEIENARFTLLNKMKPEDVPLQITHIDFHIDNLKVDTGRLTGKEKIFFSDNVVLKSRDQDILFPDGRHRLSYRKFRINIEKKIVEFDSCTIAAVRKGNSQNDFSIFFDELVMTNIDFDTLYRTEVIKADSVYAVNPQFKLNVDLGKKGSGKKNPPRIDDLIRQLTGDMYLNFVVVNNASFDIKTTRDGNPNSFTSQENNFEIQGLRIDKEAARPLSVNKFAMAIRNYENFLRDSTYEMQFDSVILVDDRIFLNNFSFRKVNRGKTVNWFRVPRFQMTGLSWDDLLFEQKLTAQRATLYNPKILFRESPRKNGAKKSRKLFDVLADVNEIIMLEDLNIINGDIDMKLNGGVEMQLENATVSIESRSLLGSSELSGIRRSVNHLDFNKGELRVNDVLVSMEGIRYTGSDSRLHAVTARIINDSKTLDALAKQVRMNEIVINEFTGDVSIAGITWEEGEVKLQVLPRGKGRGEGSFISMTDISGKNTRFTAVVNGKTISTQFDQLEAVALSLNPGERPFTGGIAAMGRELVITDSQSTTRIARYEIADLRKGHLEDLSYFKVAEGDTTEIKVPHVSFVPNIQAAIGGEFRAGTMLIRKPEIHLHKARPVRAAAEVPDGRIDRLVIEQPVVRLSGPAATLEWKGNRSETNAVVLTDIKKEGSVFTTGQGIFMLNHFTYNGQDGKKFDAGKGSISALVNDIRAERDSAGKTVWKGDVASLEAKDFLLDSLGKRSGSVAIKSIQVKDISLHSGFLGNTRKLLGDNRRFWIQQFTGEYADARSILRWHNAGYDKNTQTAFIDSLVFRPAAAREEFIASSKFQSDYIQISTGAIRVGPFNLDRYLEDSIFRAGTLEVENLVLNDYRDNRLPFRSGIIKPLLTDRIRALPVKLAVDTVVYRNADITYAEVDPKTKKTGVALFNRATLHFFPVRNVGLGSTDSLGIRANGYLMDSIWVRLRMKQSYTDSLSGFLLTVRMNSADMTVLNPVFIPMASARVRSGWLDSLSMRVAGGEYMSFGEMRMYYHGLRVQLLRDGADGKRGFMSFLANSFIIRNKNSRKVSSVFFVRNRERSPVNYLIKTLMSGVSSSTGVKSNRKQIRQYKKELRQRNLPPVDYD